MITRYFRLFNTLKYLKPTQLAFFILRRKLPGRHIPEIKSSVSRSGIELGKPISTQGIWVKDTFRFLNVEKAFSDKIDWSPEDVPRLWRYNLHYFDYLRQADRSAEEKLSLIHQWIDNNPQGSQPAWEPFTTSLRIVNWIFFLIQNPSAQKEQVLNNLYTQVLWLEKNDERHILANHYFENLKSLAFAGIFFKGSDADRWLGKSVRELSVQLKEQTLSDGGHYERSPQYHGLMVENYLDLYNLCINNQSLFDDAFTKQCLDKAQKGIHFLNQIVFPDHTIPLFNDSAFGIGPTIDQLEVYFQNLTGKSAINSGLKSALINYPDSGFLGYRSDNSMFIIDAGNIGPSYQPGHTHCDMLSYELMWLGERIIVDTGVCEYEPGEMRRYVRSTRAHNTVSIDQQEQSEIWGEFRVARRANILGADIVQIGNIVNFEGAYTGFPTIKGNYVHTRKASLTLDTDKSFSEIVVVDEITGAGNHTVESFIHLHPDVTLDECGEKYCLIKSKSGQMFRLEWEHGIQLSQEPAYYCPEFGLQIPNVRLVFSLQADLPLSINYWIKKIIS